jgi:hypothetical protein
MRLVIRCLGILIILDALVQEYAALRAGYGELDVIGDFALPIAWGIVGYGLLRLREWGRQLMLLICAQNVLGAVISIFRERHINGEAFGMLVFGVSIAFLLMRRSVVTAVQEAGSDPAREPQIEGWLAGAAGLISFGAIWYAILLPVSRAIWYWYWSLTMVAQVILFLLAGSYFVGLAWLTVVVPFYVSSYFYKLAAQADPTVARQ